MSDHRPPAGGAVYWTPVPGEPGSAVYVRDDDSLVDLEGNPVEPADLPRWAPPESEARSQEGAGTMTHRPTREQVLEDLWDDGNAVGLDGWVGPGRGSGEVDDEAIRARRRAVEKALAKLAERDARRDRR